MRCGDLLDRRLQGPEGPLGDEACDVRGHAAARMGFVHHHQPPGLLHALKNGVLVERRRGTRVDDLAVDAFPLQSIRRLLGEMHHASQGNDGHIVALPHHTRLPERHDVAFLRNVSFEPIQELVFAEDNGVIVADRLDEQPLGIVGR